MIKPTVGRVVLFFPVEGAPPQAATIAAVHTDTEVNLGVFLQGGSVSGYTNVPLLDENQAPPMSGPFCTWMPYQLGQAAKTESAEDKIEAKLREFGSATAQALAAWEKQIEDHALAVQDTFNGLHARLDALENRGAELISGVSVAVQQARNAAQAAVEAVAGEDAYPPEAVAQAVVAAVQSLPAITDPDTAVAAHNAVCDVIQNAIGSISAQEVSAVHAAVTSTPVLSEKYDPVASAGAVVSLVDTMSQKARGLSVAEYVKQAE